MTGEAQAGVDITMTKPEGEEDKDKGPGWIINVTVLDANGKPLPNATVTCTEGVAAVTTGADGTAAVGPIPIPKTYPEEPFAVTLTPSVVVKSGDTEAGSAVAVSYEGTTPTAVTLTIPVAIPDEVTISGTVLDANGVGVSGAVVTGGALAATSTGGGAFSIGPFILTKDESVTLTGTVTSGTLSFSGAPVTVSYDGVNKSIAGVVITLDIETETDVTITGFVRDVNGRAIEGAAVTGGGGSATTDGSGQYTLPAFRHKLGTPITISASIVASDGSTVAGQATFSPKTDAASAPVIVLQVEGQDVYQVTVSGSVVDENSNPVAGAVVTAGAAATTSAGDGSFSLPPIDMTKDQTVSVSASHTDGQDSYAGGPVTRTFDGTNTDIGGVILVLKKGQKSQITVSGTVTSTSGSGLGGATVTGGGASTVTDGAGYFTLGPISHELNTPLSVEASYTDADGNIRSGSGSVTPTSGAASVAITIDVSTDEDEEEDDDFEDDELDSILDSLLNAADTTIDLSAKVAEFQGIAAELDRIAAGFYSNADWFDQRLRELGTESCENDGVKYALPAAQGAIEEYSAMLVGLAGVYGELSIQAGLNPGAVDMSEIDSEYDRLEGQEGAMKSRYQKMLASFGAYKCDEDKAEEDSGDKSRDDADPDDVETGAGTGGGVEVCDGKDNDGDGIIDPCSAGCCEKNVQVYVDDCGTADDDIFVIEVAGRKAGVTPKGSETTVDVELLPGDYTVTITCVDDGGEPGEADDIGTACVSIVAYDQEVEAFQNGVQVLPQTPLSIALNASAVVGFTVPGGTVAPAPLPAPDMSILDGLEQQ